MIAFLLWFYLKQGTRLEDVDNPAEPE